MAQKFANAARAVLAAGVGAGDTTITIVSGGSLFPVVASPDFARAVLQDANGIEIVLITAHTANADSFTVTRAQEGTTARTFAAGSVFGVRVTAADMDEAVSVTPAGSQTLTNKTFGDNPTFSAGTANGVAYLNGSKVLTTGSALTFAGTSLGINGASANILFDNGGAGGSALQLGTSGTSHGYIGTIAGNFPLLFQINSAEQMRLTSTGLGIGTSSPSSRLTVAGGAVNLTTTASNHNIAQGTGWVWSSDGTASGTLRGGIYGNADGSLSLFGGPTVTTQLRLDTSGNLGLGVTPTGQSKFQVYTGNNAINGIQTQFNGSNPPIALASTTSNGFPYVGFNTVQVVNSDNQTYATSGFASRISHVQGGNGGFQFNVAPSGTAGNAISFTQAMTLDAAGRLALGTTTILGSSNRASFANDTSAKGVLALQSTSTSGYSAIELYDNSGSQQGAVGWGNASVAVGGAASATYLYSTGAITFLSGGTTERARITSGGDFGIGTSSPNSKLQVNSGTNLGGVLIGFNGGSSNFYDADLQVFRTGNGTERARITSGGNLLVGTTSAIAGAMLSVNGLISDAVGNVRAIPPSGTRTSSYTLVKADVGDYVQVGSGGSITIPDAVFAEGDVVSLFNNTAGTVTITCSITTAYIGGADADKATMTLAARGVATILFISGTVCVVNGNVV